MDEELNNRIECRAILELLGKPADYIDNTAKNIIATIKKNENYEILNEFLSDTEDREHLFSKFIELDLKIKNLPAIFDFCFDFMPSSIEIIKPEKLTLESRDMTAFLSDLQARLHNSDMATKKMNSIVKYLRSNIFKLVKNMLTILLRGNTLDLQTLSKHTGIGEKELNTFLESLIKQNFLKKDGDKYTLAK